MEEPLTKSVSNFNFSGKSHNNHPLWYKEPLRLTEEQRNDPFLVFKDFFECFHLNDTREILWDWLTGIVSISSRVLNQPHYCNNQIYFYEKFEELIEAALLITKSAQSKEREDLAQPIVTINDKNRGIFSKSKHLIEDGEINPFDVLKQVFNPDKDFIIQEVKEWLLIGLSADSTLFDEAEQRSSLIVFHDQLIMLIEALFVITLLNLDNTEVKDQLSKAYSITELSINQQGDPEKVLVDFFEKYPIKHINSELDNWFESSISYSGEWRGNVICLQQVWDIYRNVQYLIKSAEQLNNRIINQSMQNPHTGHNIFSS